jgi:hypothetical protein
VSNVNLKAVSAGLKAERKRLVKELKAVDGLLGRLVGGKQRVARRKKKVGKSSRAASTRAAKGAGRVSPVTEDPAPRQQAARRPAAAPAKAPGLGRPIPPPKKLAAKATVSDAEIDRLTADDEDDDN